METMRKIGVILLSGGLDSTTVAAYALKEGYELTGVTLLYGQKHSREVDSAREIARILKIKLVVLDVAFFKQVAWYSALTAAERFDVPRERRPAQMAKDIPITYVPLRNTFFITVAAAFLESEVLNLIEQQGVAPAEIQPAVFIAANAVDYSGYPDCRPEYYQQIGRTLFLGSKLGTQYGRQIALETPIIALSKAEIVKMGMALKAPLAYTWSCYEGGARPCGKCDSCLLRAAGFREAGAADPLLTRLKEKGEHAGG